MTEHINLNNDWRYRNHFDEGMLKTDYDESAFEPVRIPHTNVITPYHYFDEQIYQFISCYRRHIDGKEEWRDMTILLNFEAVGHIAKIYLNGEYIMTQEGGYTAFTVNLTPYIRLGENNVLVVEVDSRECNNLPPFGNVIDYMTYGGIYREVSLEIKPKRYLEDAYIITREIEGGNEANHEIELWVMLGGEEPEDGQPLKELSLIYSVLDQDGRPIHRSTSPVSGQSFQIRFNVSGVKNWELEKPVLYQLELELQPKEMSEKPIDRKRLRFGFRSCEFRKDGFYLNHRKVKLSLRWDG